MRVARSPRGLRASILGSSRSAVRFAVRIVSAPHRQIARAPREPNRRPRISQFSSVRPILHQRQHPPNVQSHEKAISDAARRQPQIPNANAARLRAPQLGLQRPLNVSSGCCSSDAADSVDHDKRTIRLGDLRGEDSPVNPHVISIRAIRQPTSALCSVHRGQRV